jgi:hypothetical protein
VLLPWLAGLGDGLIGDAAAGHLAASRALHTLHELRCRGILSNTGADAGTIRFGVATAQRGWVAPGEVINTWPLRRLRSFLAKGRRAGRARTPVTPARAG